MKNEFLSYLSVNDYLRLLRIETSLTANRDIKVSTAFVCQCMSWNILFIFQKSLKMLREIWKSLTGKSKMLSDLSWNTCYQSVNHEMLLNMELIFPISQSDQWLNPFKWKCTGILIVSQQRMTKGFICDSDKKRIINGQV